MVCNTCCSRLKSETYKRMESRRLKKIVVVFNTIVKIPFYYFYNREELVWYATPVALD